MHNQIVDTYKNLQERYRHQITVVEQRVAAANNLVSHLDALITDEMVQELQEFGSLLEQRQQYQQQLIKWEQQLSHAKAQLGHVNALLSAFFVQQHQTISLEATREPRVLNEGEQQILGLESGQSPNIASSSPAGNGVVVTDELVPATIKDKASPATGVGTKIPLLPEFDGLTKAEAIASILQERSGSILTRDFIIRQLYGELPEDELEQEIKRTSQALYNGVKEGRWRKVKGKFGCYTIPKTEPESNGSAKAGNKGTNVPGLVAKYAGMKLIDAVEKVMKERSGQVVTPTEVAEEVYGSLRTDVERKRARKSAGQALWLGASKGRWQAVPGEIGQDKLDLPRR